MIKNTPAVTKVEECTNAETGVGAAIAAGSHLEKGIWADLVILAIRINIVHSNISFLDQRVVILQCPKLRIKAIDIMIITSPTRFIRAVIIPAPRDFGFW